VPIYEFVCEACGHLSEVMQKVSEPPPGKCKECGAGPLARMVSRTTFQLKGGGWYSDLYATPKKKKDAEAAGGASGSAAGAGSSPGSASTPGTGSGSGSGSTAGPGPASPPGPAKK
jgi:putative FmdB family regulatory protein